MKRYRVKTFQSGEFHVNFAPYILLQLFCDRILKRYTVYSLQHVITKSVSKKHVCYAKLKCTNRRLFRLLVMNINNAFMYFIRYMITLEEFITTIQGPHTQCQLQVNIWSVQSLQHHHLFHFASNMPRHMFCFFLVFQIFHN